MTDTTTTVLAFVKQTVGGNRNTWGAILNATLDLIEEAICARTSVSTTGGSTTLTQAQARKHFIDVSGGLTSDATIVVPNATKSWVVTNACTGGYAVLVKTADGTAVSVPAGTAKHLSCNGSNVVARLDKCDVGTVAFYGGSAVPSGWVECNGQAISRAGIGLDLFGVTGTTWGVGNGATTFNVPDTYTAGKFLRSRTAAVALATSQDSQNKAHTHPLSSNGSAATSGAHIHHGTTDSGGAHSHTITITDPGHTHTVTVRTTDENVAAGGGTGTSITNSTATTSSQTTGITASSNSTGAHTHTFATDSSGDHTHTLAGTTDSDGGTEARPTNLSMILCIRL